MLHQTIGDIKCNSSLNTQKQVPDRSKCIKQNFKNIKVRNERISSSYKGKNEVKKQGTINTKDGRNYKFDYVNLILLYKTSYKAKEKFQTGRYFQCI